MKSNQTALEFNSISSASPLLGPEGLTFNYICASLKEILRILIWLALRHKRE